MNLIGTQLKNYKFLSQIGEGGMGVVYKAYDLTLERYVAIKMIREELIGRKSLIQKFMNEAKNLAKLKHPNIVTVFGLLETENNVGIIMELVDGDDLYNVIDRSKELKLSIKLSVWEQILNACSYAHSNGFIHKDIKPSNILITQNGEVKISDFGLSISIFDETSNNAPKTGTLHYMSPEQILGKNITVQSDVYSIGCTFYEILTGRVPFDAINEFNLIEAHFKRSIPKVNNYNELVNVSINDFLEKSLAKSEDFRYDTCDIMLREVHKIMSLLDEEEVKTKETAHKRSKPDKIKSLLYTGATIVVGIILIYFSFLIIKNFFSESKLIKANETTYTASDDSNNLEKLNVVDVKWSNSISATSVICKDSIIHVSSASGNIYRIINDDIIDSIEVFNAPITKMLGIENHGIFVLNEKEYAVIENREQMKIIVSGSTENIKITDIEYVNGNVFCVDVSGNFFRYNIEKNKFIPISKIADELIYGIVLFNLNHGYAVSENGNIYHTDNSGLDWKKSEFKSTSYLLDATIIENTLITFGGKGSYNTQVHNSNDWINYNFSSPKPLKELVVFSKNKFLFLAGSNNFYYSKDGMKTWLEYFDILDAKIEMIFPEKENVIYCLLSDGKIKKIEL